MQGYAKYRNRKTIVDGIKFDSKKESARFQELKLLERSGQISDLRMQVKFSICPKSGGNRRERFYIADFVYCEGGKKIIEDVKSKATAFDKVFSLKWALMKWLYPEYEYRIYN